MSRIRRGNYVFVTWLGDHAPRHVHVFRDRKLVVKWDLEEWKPIHGRPDRKMLKHLTELIREGRL